MNTRVYVVFDRKKRAKDGVGKLDICVYFDRSTRRFFPVGEASADNWEKVAKRPAIQAKVRKFEKVLEGMETFGEEVTPETFKDRLEQLDVEISGAAARKQLDKLHDVDFIKYVETNIEEEDIAEGTRAHKYVVLDALKRFGKFRKLADLTPANVLAFDRWLHDGTRTDVTCYGYHKKVHKYIIQLVASEMLMRDPYKGVKLSRGKSKERQPLSEKELAALRSFDLPKKLAQVRDLFVFAAYTGLAYCDVMAFDYERNTVQVGDLHYIDSERMKTGNKFFTPILGPALEVLERYDFKLPHISNQKANDYLHVIEEKMDLHKPLTFHVARHSFATLALAHDVPIENVARMLGHSDIKTTQIYAKILNTTVERHSEALAKAII